MLKRSLRVSILAAMFSAAFFIGRTNVVNAYTYNGDTITVDELAYDSTDLVVTGSANVTSKKDINPKVNNGQKQITYDSILLGLNIAYNHVGDDFELFYIKGLPSNTTTEIANEIINVYKKVSGELGYLLEDKYESDATITNPFTDINKKYGLNIDFDGGYGAPPDYTDGSDGSFFSFDNLYYIDGKWSADYTEGNKTYTINNTKLIENNNKTATGTYFYRNNQTITVNKTEIIPSSITVTNNSTLTGKANILTSKNINVENTSKLITATGTITGGTITSDGDIIAEANYSAPSGKSTIGGASITSTGALTASKDIKATTGVISATVINATSGNIISNNSIKSAGKVKGNALNVGVINASTASITGNQSINGIFTTTGQAKLNGGATLGGKKITGLSIGTLSTSSTDAVNGKQLYTAMQSSGKTYTAGSDISISSANAISVAKAGKVASGDTGIMTGDAVYQETSKIDSFFKANNTSITSNNSKLDNLTTSIESLRKSLGTINSSVSDAISGLPGSLANFANKDLTDLSDTGINTLKSYIKSEIKKQMPSNTKTASYAMEGVVTKDTSAIDNVIASKANASDLTALGSKVDSKADKSDVSLVEDSINTKADLSYVNDGLAKKTDQSVVETVGSNVVKNTSAIAKNTELIQTNTKAISELNDSKADSSGSNIDVSSWSNKLGTGTVARDDTGLVTGSSVASTLDKKADIGYVAIGLGAMESGLDQMSQQVTKDVSRVGAGTSALMGLHPTGDKFEFATGYGHYKNSNNTALGVFYKPSANSTVSIAGTIGDGDAMLSAGVSIKLGLNKEVKKVITPEEFGTMKTAVESQDEKLDQMEKTLQQLMAR